MKRGARSPWRSLAASTDPRPVELAQPSQWERLLQELRLSEEEVVELLCSPVAQGSMRACRIARWVRANGYAVFVPEAVLQVLGVRPKDEFSPTGYGAGLNGKSKVVKEALRMRKKMA